MPKPTMMFNPYTGKPRHPSDIQSDPEGILLVESTENLPAAVNSAQPVAPDLLQAVENFIAVKGRHHTEQAYQRLVSVFEQVKGE